jgi:ATP-dependent RNA helicase DDX24/MAK5
MDSFRASPVGVLVATDIAARGLDIAKVQYVLHYDVARSVQVYVHRSGRTARAGSKGTTISLVSPQDESHHADICRALSVPALPSYKVDLSVLPELRSHVNLAKKVRIQSTST